MLLLPCFDQTNPVFTVEQIKKAVSKPKVTESLLALNCTIWTKVCRAPDHHLHTGAFLKLVPKKRRQSYRMSLYALALRFPLWELRHQSKICSSIRKPLCTEVFREDMVYHEHFRDGLEQWQWLHSRTPLANIRAWSYQCQLLPVIILWNAMLKRHTGVLGRFPQTFLHIKSISVSKSVAVQMCVNVKMILFHPF